VGVADGGNRVGRGSATRTLGGAFVAVANRAAGDGVTDGDGVEEAVGVGIGVGVSSGVAVTAITTMRGGGSPPAGGTAGGGRLRAASSTARPKNTSNTLISRVRLFSARAGG
jgi:hypothetical protein